MTESCAQRVIECEARGHFVMERATNDLGCAIDDRMTESCAQRVIKREARGHFVMEQ